MRIAIYYPRYLIGDGGPTLAVRGWVEALRGAGAEVGVFCQQSPERLDLAPDGVLPLPHQGSGRTLRPAGLRHALRGWDVLWLHSGWVWYNVAAASHAQRLGIPYVVTPHGAYDPNVLRRRAIAKRFWWITLERQLLVRSAALHVFFEGEQAGIRGLGYRGRFVTAPNGIEVPPAPTWDGRTGGYLLWLGRYDVQHKGLDIMLEAVAALPRDQRPLVRMHGPDHRGGRREVERLVAGLGLSEIVEAGGPVYGAAKEEAFARAAAFIYPSRWDAHSVAVLEALARGVPVIATASMHIAPVLEGSGAGFVAKPEPSDLARAIERAISTEGGTVARMGRMVCQEQFAWPAVARAFLAQVHSLLDSRVGAR
jgi:glycosyltransferase involved in cell wall biosynthesis